MTLNNIIYVRIKPSLLSVKNVYQELYYEDVPLIALSKKDGKILAFGKSAEVYQSNLDAEVINGFDHIRSIVGNYMAAAKTVEQFIKKVDLKKPWRIFSAPFVIIHPLEKLEGGLTQIEIRGLQDIGYRAKAHKVYVWTGRILMDEEVRYLKFPNEKELIK